MTTKPRKYRLLYQTTKDGLTIWRTKAQSLGACNRYAKTVFIRRGDRKALWVKIVPVPQTA